jgi:chromosome segregation ATPase
MSELKAEELEHIAYMQTIEIQKLNARIAELEAENRNLMRNLFLIDDTEKIATLNTRIAELKGVIEILEYQQREAKNHLIDKNLHIDSLYEEGYKLQQRIAELEEENETLKTACDILRGDNNLLFKRLMSIETPGDLQTLKIVYVKEDSEVQE